MRAVPVLAGTGLDEQLHVQLGGGAHAVDHPLAYRVQRIVSDLQHQFVVHLHGFEGRVRVPAGFRGFHGSDHWIRIEKSRSSEQDPTFPSIDTCNVAPTTWSWEGRSGGTSFTASLISNPISSSSRASFSQSAPASSCICASSTSIR